MPLNKIDIDESILGFADAASRGSGGLADAHDLVEMMSIGIFDAIRILRLLCYAELIVATDETYFTAFKCFQLTRPGRLRALAIDDALPEYLNLGYILDTDQMRSEIPF